MFQENVTHIKKLRNEKARECLFLSRFRNVRRTDETIGVEDENTQMCSFLTKKRMTPPGTPMNSNEYGKIEYGLNWLWITSSNM